MFRKSGWLLGGVFLAFGLVFGGIGAAAAYSNHRFAENAEAATGIVSGFAARRSDDGTAYAPLVIYRDATGTVQRFQGKVASSPPAYDRGEKVDVLYDPARPGRAVIDSFWQRNLLAVIFGAFGVIFGGIGAALLAGPVRRRTHIARLKAGGVPIEASVIEIFRDTGMAINGRHPFRVAAQGKHPVTKRTRRFESDPLWVDPTGLVGESVTVLVHPGSKAKHHYMDLPRELLEA